MYSFCPGINGKVTRSEDFIANWCHAPEWEPWFPNPRADVNIKKRRSSWSTPVHAKTPEPAQSSGKETKKLTGTVEARHKQAVWPHARW